MTEYGRENLISAIEGMASGSGTLKERLADAFGLLHRINPFEDLPGSMVDEFGAITAVVSRQLPYANQLKS